MTSTQNITTTVNVNTTVNNAAATPAAENTTAAAKQNFAEAVTTQQADTAEKRTQSDQKTNTTNQKVTVNNTVTNQNTVAENDAPAAKKQDAAPAEKESTAAKSTTVNDDAITINAAPGSRVVVNGVQLRGENAQELDIDAEKNSTVIINGSGLPRSARVTAPEITIPKPVLPIKDEPYKDVGNGWKVFDTSDQAFIGSGVDGKKEKYNTYFGWVDKAKSELVVNYAWGDPHLQQKRIKIARGTDLTDPGVLNELLRRADVGKNTGVRRDFYDAAFISASGEAKFDFDTVKESHRLTVTAGVNVTINRGPGAHDDFTLEINGINTAGRKTTEREHHGWDSVRFDRSNKDGPIVLDGALTARRGDAFSILDTSTGSTRVWNSSEVLNGNPNQEYRLNQPDIYRPVRRYENHYERPRYRSFAPRVHYHNHYHNSPGLGFRRGYLPVAPHAFLPPVNHFGPQPFGFGSPYGSGMGSIIAQLSAAVQQLSGLLSSGGLYGGLQPGIGYQSPLALGSPLGLGLGTSPFIQQNNFYSGGGLGGLFSPSLFGNSNPFSFSSSQYAGFGRGSYI